VTGRLLARHSLLFIRVTAGAQYPCGPRGLLLVDRGLVAVLSFLKNFRAFFCSFFCVIIFETLSFFVRIFSLLCDYMCESFCILRRILLYSYCIILLCISCGKSRIILSDLNSLLYRVILGDTLHGVKRGGGCIQVERPLLKLPSESVTLDCVSEFGRVVVLKGLLACLIVDRHAQVSTWFSLLFNIELDINFDHIYFSLICFSGKSFRKVSLGR